MLKGFNVNEMKKYMEPQNRTHKKTTSGLLYKTKHQTFVTPCFQVNTGIDLEKPT